MNVVLLPPEKNPDTRIIASPFARRLALERALPLSEISGSGPRGRIIALDVFSFEPPLSAAAHEPPSIPASQTADTVSLGGLGTTADIAALSVILAEFAALGLEISLEDALIRAAAKALAAEPDDQIPGAGIVAFETAVGDQLLIGADQVSAMTQRARRLETDPVTPAGNPAELSLWLPPSKGIRANFLPLRTGRALRLAVSISSDEAELLLVFSTETVSEVRAASLLVAIRDNLEASLGLFA